MTVPRRHRTPVESLEHRRLLSVSPTLDDGFAGNGQAQFSLSSAAYQQASRVVAAGNNVLAFGGGAAANYGVPTPFASPAAALRFDPPFVGVNHVTRLLPNGSVDPSFAPRALAGTPLDGFGDFRGVPGGNGIFASRLVDGLGSNPSFEVRKFTNDLAPDSAFAPVSVPLNVNLGQTLDYGYDYAVDSAGKVLVGRFTSDRGQEFVTLQRYTATGSLEASGVIGGSQISNFRTGDLPAGTRLDVSTFGFRRVGLLNNGGAYLAYTGTLTPITGQVNDGRPSPGVVTLGTSLGTVTAREQRNPFAGSSFGQFVDFWSHPDGRYVLAGAGDGQFDTGGKLGTFREPIGRVPSRILDVTFPQGGGIAGLVSQPSTTTPVRAIRGSDGTAGHSYELRHQATPGGPVTTTTLPRDATAGTRYHFGTSITADARGGVVIGGSLLELTREAAGDGDRITGVTSSSAAIRYTFPTPPPPPPVNPNLPPRGITFDTAAVGTQFERFRSGDVSARGRNAADNGRSDLTAVSVAGNPGIRVADDTSRIRFNRDEMRPFAFTGLDLAATSAATAGDATLVGDFTDGTIRRLDVAFGSTSYTRINVGWEGLRQLDLVSSGGVNGFAPLVDNVVITPFVPQPPPPPSNPPRGITFEDAAVGTLFERYRSGDVSVRGRNLADNGRTNLTAASAASGVALRAATDASRVRFNRDEMRPFNLGGIDLAASSSSRGGDAVLIGEFRDGTVRTLDVAFPTTSFVRLDPNWTDLRQVDLVSVGGMNDFMPLIDNLVVTPFVVPPPPANPNLSPRGITFEDAVVGGAFERYRSGDVSLRGRNAADNGRSNLTADGVQGNKGVRVQQDASFIRINRDEMRPFNLGGLDLAALSAATAGDVLLTGRFKDGRTETRTLAFGSTNYTRFDINWTNLDFVDVVSAGGVNGFAPLLDNVVVTPFTAAT